MVISNRSASRVSAGAMRSREEMGSHEGAAPILHGGDLGAARLLFPGAPEPFIDLSTGINPYPYPIPPLGPDLFTRLPQEAALDRLAGHGGAGLWGAIRRPCGAGAWHPDPAVPGGRAGAAGAGRGVGADLRRTCPG